MQERRCPLETLFTSGSGWGRPVLPKALPALSIMQTSWAGVPRQKPISGVLPGSVAGPRAVGTLCAGPPALRPAHPLGHHLPLTPGHH